MSERREADDVVAEFPFGDGGEDGDEDHRCPDCDRTFSTERGLNIHRGQQHPEDGA